MPALTTAETRLRREHRSSEAAQVKTNTEPENWVALTQGAPMHTLYLGSPNGHGFDHDALDAVQDMIALQFRNFTIVPANGFYEGRRVHSLVVYIATADTRAVHALGRQLALSCEQEVVGLQLMGQYYSIAATPSYNVGDANDD